MQDCLALGAIFAATDTVAVLQVIRPEEAGILYSLVFGEGVMNDATSVALLRAVQVREQPPRVVNAVVVRNDATSVALLRAVQVHLSWEAR
jgi:NhaP-type Na+/H+ or K+/H+ antiporter